MHVAYRFPEVCIIEANNLWILQVGNFDNIYHFVLGERERARAPTNAPYTTKSSALLSEKSVRKHNGLLLLSCHTISCVCLQLLTA